MQFRRAHNFTTLALAALFAVAGTGSRAEVLDGLLEVRSAYVDVKQGVFQLFARVAYPVNEDIRAALKDGLMLSFDLDVVVSRERRFWMDETVAEYTLRRELIYHAVSDRYVARDVDAPGNDQHSYATLEEALEALGTVEAWPFLLSPQLSANRQYRVSLRAGVRRGRLSDTMRVLLFWTDGWHRESEWFSWSLQR
jgi:hypothetical protein